MATRTKEELERLEEKIARIKIKDEEILKRRQEIDEDIRLAKQQGALVNIRQSTTNLSREPTPALRPSNRELREDFSDESFQDSSFQGSSRDTSRERRGGQLDRKAPPPDPRSFLHDKKRDKEDLRHKGEFKRGGCWGSGNRGIEGDIRGRRGGLGRGAPRGRGSEQQRAAGGRWRRMWDEKINTKFVKVEKVEEGYQEINKIHEKDSDDLVIKEGTMDKKTEKEFLNC